MPDPLVDRLRAELEQTGIRVAAAMVVLERSRRRGDEIRFAITDYEAALARADEGLLNAHALKTAVDGPPARADDAAARVVAGPPHERAPGASSGRKSSPPGGHKRKALARLARRRPDLLAEVEAGRLSWSVAEKMITQGGPASDPPPEPPVAKCHLKQSEIARRGDPQSKLTRAEQDVWPAAVQAVQDELTSLEHRAEVADPEALPVLHRRRTELTGKLEALKVRALSSTAIQPGNGPDAVQG